MLTKAVACNTMNLDNCIASNRKGGVFLINKTQIMKGILEGCVLAVLSREKLYSQEIPKKLLEFKMSDVSDGTLFPLLLRLEKNGFISAYMMESPLGPKRKYYTITKAGKEHLASFEECWYATSDAVNAILSAE